VTFDELTCEAAVEGGDLKVLQWLRSEGCPWDAEECLAIAEDLEDDDAVEWINKEIYGHGPCPECGSWDCDGAGGGWW
jgi:hypothetical protein